MSETILTHAELEGLTREIYACWRVGEPVDNEGQIESVIDSHRAALERLSVLEERDAAVFNMREQMYALDSALDTVTSHWIGRTDAHGIDFDEDAFEQELMALDRAFDALHAAAWNTVWAMRPERVVATPDAEPTT